MSSATKIRRRALSFFITAACLLAVVTPPNVFAQETRDREIIDDDKPAPEEVEEVQQFARLFVRRMQETRDLAPLVGELIAMDFAVPNKQDFFERIDTKLYAKLSRADKARWELAQWNTVYILTLVLTCSTAERPYADERNIFSEFLPADLAARLREFETPRDESKINDDGDFRRRLDDYESALAEARQRLVIMNLEGSSCFQQRLADAENNLGANIDYRVRHYSIDEEDRTDEQVARLGVTKFYRVETPLFLGLIVIRDKDTGRLKIIAFDVGDGD